MRHRSKGTMVLVEALVAFWLRLLGKRLFLSLLGASTLLVFILIGKGV